MTEYFIFCENMYGESFVWGYRFEDCHKVLHAIAHFHSDPALKLLLFCAVLNPSRTMHAHLKTISTPGFHPHAPKHTGSYKSAMWASYSIVIIMQWKIGILIFSFRMYIYSLFPAKVYKSKDHVLEKQKQKQNSIQFHCLTACMNQQ